MLLYNKQISKVLFDIMINTYMLKKINCFILNNEQTMSRNIKVIIGIRFMNQRVR